MGGFLLIDRRMINQQTGKLIQQKAVTPTFDFSTIKEVVDRHVQNYDAGLEKRALNHIVDNWDTIPQRIKDLKKGSKTKKSVDTLANQTVVSKSKDQHSVRQIVGPSGKNYGTGVYLDSTLLDNLSEDERMEMVKEYVKELGGNVFTAYDKSVNAVDVHLVEWDSKDSIKSILTTKAPPGLGGAFYIISRTADRHRWGRASRLYRSALPMHLRCCEWNPWLE